MMGLLWSRYSALFYASVTACVLGIIGIHSINAFYAAIPFALATLVGTYDLCQKRRPVLANFPLIGR
ncbi:hypothetical protein, partial [Nereida sp.]|uniref:hypothetical protein n=1 Tax=Nereida sp. TaxID=2736090 RepID=UPI003F69EE20